ncbi:hypothetical protein ES288_D09G048800v1 [Gossypium darwinii]|uniref:Uncharacterized protein n=1 Tax=Gossypium darwinii TaxID=34276 RepID=A0A5D2B5U7_GOSDA|nr:hypothetical protein ES288_D09G048800v1 [Gossypium darwinii]TYG52691.1 hypothetical protein ES288_D09G048800v1 [Gossypium darwinii]
MESEQADSHKMDFNATEEEEFGFSRNYFLAKEMGSSGKKSARKLSDINVVDEQLRFETEDKASRLLSNVSFFLKPKGYFFGITPEKVIAKNCCFEICVFFFFFSCGYCWTCFWEVIV